MLFLRKYTIEIGFDELEEVGCQLTDRRTAISAGW